MSPRFVKTHNGSDAASDPSKPFHKGEIIGQIIGKKTDDAGSAHAKTTASAIHQACGSQCRRRNEVNSTSAAAIVPAPQGYLTPTSGTPIITSDVISNTSLVYTPYLGNLVPIYSGTSFVPTVFSELTLTLTSSQAASTLYDVFIFNNSGALTLVTGPAWSNSTAGSCSRGTGAGTTQISKLSGIWVNTVSMTGRNSSNTYTIPANQATYLGSIFIDGTAGQITLHRSYGQSRKWAIWNAYNRVPI